MENLKTIEGKVRAVLQENEDARNDDMVLYLALCNCSVKIVIRIREFLASPAIIVGGKKAEFPVCF